MPAPPMPDLAHHWGWQLLLAWGWAVSPRADEDDLDGGDEAYGSSEALPSGKVQPSKGKIYPLPMGG